MAVPAQPRRRDLLRQGVWLLACAGGSAPCDVLSQPPAGPTSAGQLPADSDAGRSVSAQVGSTDASISRVDTHARGRALEVAAIARVEAPAALIWETITDYERLADFVPGISSSRILERQGNVVRVRQTGRAHLMIFGFDVDVTVEAIEQPPDSVEARLVSGTLRRLEGRYLIETTRSPGRANLRWDGVIEPAAEVPAFIGRAVARATIEAQFASMAAEIVRRAGLRS